MKLENLLAEAMLNGQTEQVLTAVGEALSECNERFHCSSKYTVDQAEKFGRPFVTAATAVYLARNQFTKDTQ